MAPNKLKKRRRTIVASHSDHFGYVAQNTQPDADADERSQTICAWHQMCSVIHMNDTVQ